MAKKDRADKAEKTTDPAKMGRIRQIIFAYQRTHEYDKALPFLLIGCFVLPIALGIVLGLLFTQFIVSTILLGVMIGLLLAMLMLVRRTKQATYKRYAGQAGSAEVALSMLPKKWISSPAIAANRQLDAVHRTIGPGGLILIGEGEPGRLKNLLASEARKHEKVAYGVKVTTIVMGTKPGQVPLEKLADHIRKLPKQLEANQITEIKSRLNALDAIRPQMPVPKGPMPTNPRQIRGAKQAMRGR
ncbi:DUF4191 domain-containing protein [Microlunatus soli]|uniref:DUF4191 domain-containing protein n=1 Tax=Microlunatus soli TaxID=630515 RepID=A0A1H1PVQ6_9ACTN|nr:DUF4191 domain-containing protein [Microlunatus soli]SDS15057.1 protein of unknown function [Microlunatus soli]